MLHWHSVSFVEVSNSHEVFVPFWYVHVCTFTYAYKFVAHIKDRISFKRSDYSFIICGKERTSESEFGIACSMCFSLLFCNSLLA